MKWMSGLVMAVALAAAPAAMAEEAVDPVRLELAKQLVAASGGSETSA